MELCTGGELFHHIVSEKWLSESLAADYMYQILSVVAYCHSKGIVHRDLKPANIMLSRKNNKADLKIIDFGASRLISRKDGLSKCIGTVIQE
jgi:serine/threonine protein kinase